MVTVLPRQSISREIRLLAESGHSLDGEAGQRQCRRQGEVDLLAGLQAGAAHHAGWSPAGGDPLHRRYSILI
ncbi:MAG: hypothetical protein PVJ15_05075 [Gammaproteobacteria bacterium]